MHSPYILYSTYTHRVLHHISCITYCYTIHIRRRWPCTLWYIYAWPTCSLTHINTTFILRHIYACPTAPNGCTSTTMLCTPTATLTSAPFCPSQAAPAIHHIYFSMRRSSEPYLLFLGEGLVNLIYFSMRRSSESGVYTISASLWEGIHYTYFSMRRSSEPYLLLYEKVQWCRLENRQYIAICMI